MIIGFCLNVADDAAGAAPIRAELVQQAAQVGTKAGSDRAHIRAQIRIDCGAQVSLAPMQIAVPHASLRCRLNAHLAWAMQRRSSAGVNA